MTQPYLSGKIWYACTRDHFLPGKIGALATFIHIAKDIEGRSIGVVETYNWQQFFLVAADSEKDLTPIYDQFFSSYDRAVNALKEASRYRAGSLEFRLCLNMYADNGSDSS